MKKEYDRFLLASAKSSSAKKRVQEQLKDANNQRLYNYQGGGGGFSNLFALPGYQRGISGVGTYNAQRFVNLKAGQMNWHAKLINGTQAGRNVPDISANADPLTGYSLYVDGYHQFLGGAGTSIATPQIAAMAALINQSKHQRMGFWNPQIYRFAKTSHSPFTPLNSLDDNNLYYVGQPGKLYNQATGLGTVDFTKLNQAFGDQ